MGQNLRPRIHGLDELTWNDPYAYRIAEGRECQKYVMELFTSARVFDRESLPVDPVVKLNMPLHDVVVCCYRPSRKKEPKLLSLLYQA